jgi:hypothetical protein
MCRLIFLLLLVVAHPVSAQQPAWYLLSRDDGCVDLKILVQAERLSRLPVSPDDFASMMRARGKEVTVGPLAGSPAELIGKVVKVTVGNEKAPVFVTEDICRTISQGR